MKKPLAIFLLLLLLMPLVAVFCHCCAPAFQAAGETIERTAHSCCGEKLSVTLPFSCGEFFEIRILKDAPPLWLLAAALLLMMAPRAFFSGALLKLPGTPSRGRIPSSIPLYLFKKNLRL